MPFASREQKRAYQREWMRRRRVAFFADKSCLHCGATEDLEIHHRDPAEKVAHAIWSWSEERRTAELAKCDVLCAPCHDVHHGMRECGTRAAYERGCRCADCRVAGARFYRRRSLRRRLRGLPVAVVDHLFELKDRAA